MRRWVGDAVAVQARAKTVVRLREDQETGECRPVHIPDHLDILVRSPARKTAHIWVTRNGNLFQEYQLIRASVSARTFRGVIRNVAYVHSNARVNKRKVLMIKRRYDSTLVRAACVLARGERLQ